MNTPNTTPTETIAAEPIHTDHVREDGTIDDTIVETYYCPVDRCVAADGYLRIFADNDATDVELRLPFSAFELWGWTIPEDFKAKAKAQKPNTGEPM